MNNKTYILYITLLSVYLLLKEAHVVSRALLGLTSSEVAAEPAFDEGGWREVFFRSFCNLSTMLNALE